MITVDLAIVAGEVFKLGQGSKSGNLKVRKAGLPPLWFSPN
jgi:hypothetical protein